MTTLPLVYNQTINDNLKKLCLPLFQYLELSYFEYSEFFNDGTVIYLATNLEWIHHSLNYEMFKDNEHNSLVAKNKFYRYVLWNTLNLDQTTFLSSMKEFKIWNGLSVNIARETSVRVYSFATDKDINIDSFLMNHISTLDHFINYFHSEGEPLLKNAAQNKVIGKILPVFTPEEILYPDHHKLKTFLEQTELKKFYFTLRNNHFFLSKREMQCLSSLSKAKTMKEIAEELSLSPRTVETYIEKIKNKSGLHFKNDLIKMYYDNFGKWI
jgi:DNA-binding CsgD family transcriptional regulator